jgi:hypothetical protein
MLMTPQLLDSRRFGKKIFVGIGSGSGSALRSSARSAGHGTIRWRARQGW